MEAVGLKVVGVTKTTVTVVWAWQRTSGPARVNRYRVILRKDSEMQSRFLSKCVTASVGIQFMSQHNESYTILIVNVTQYKI